MIEVELKFAMSQEISARLQERLATMLRAGEVRNSDLYYDTAHFDLLSQAVFVRIRNRQRLEFKFNEQKELAHTWSMERTFPLLPDAEQAQAMNALFARFLPRWRSEEVVEEALASNQLVQLACIRNRRMQYAAGDLVVCIDQVEELGDFLEIEMQCQEESEVSQAELRIQEFATLLTAQTARRVRVGYVELWLKKFAPHAYLKGLYRD